MPGRGRLVIRPGAIGDTILSLPAIEYLEPDEVWVRSEIVPLIQSAPRVRSIASTGIELLGLDGVTAPAELIERLGSFRQIVSWFGANRSEFREALGSFCRNSIFLPALPPREVDMHAADFFLQQAGGTLPALPNIRVGPAAPRDSIVFHPYSGGERKNWPIERWLELESQFSGVEWAASPNWVRFENLLELATWMAGAKLYVGNDTGITHLAAAVGMPVVALFGSTNPEIWGPRGGSVHIVHAPSMEDISISTVRAAMIRALAEGA